MISYAHFRKYTQIFPRRIRSRLSKTVGGHAFFFDPLISSIRPFPYLLHSKFSHWEYTLSANFRSHVITVIVLSMIIGRSVRGLRSVVRFHFFRGRNNNRLFTSLQSAVVPSQQLVEWKQNGGWICCQRSYRIINYYALGLVTVQLPCPDACKRESRSSFVKWIEKQRFCAPTAFSFRSPRTNTR